MRGKSQRGVALALSMMMVAVLALITAAFFEAYRSHYSLTRTSASSQAAATACETVFHYVSYRLEHDRTWGTPSYSGTITEVVAPGAAGLLDITENSTHQFSGEIASLGADIEGEIYNNLGGGVVEAPPGTALCRVKATVGTATRQAEFLLAVAPLFDSSVLTRANLSVDSNSLVMRSLDDDRNMIRAEGDIYIPNVLDGNTRSQFLLPGSTQGDSKGMLWAKGDIHAFNSTNTAWETIDDGAEIAEATTNIKGKVVPKAESHFSIYDLQEGDIRVNEANTEVVLPPGRWNFVRRQANVSFDAFYVDQMVKGEIWNDSGTYGNSAVVWVDVLEYYADPSDTTPTAVYRGAERQADIVAQVPPTATTTTGETLNLDASTVTTTGVDVLGYSTSVDLVDNDMISFNDSSGNAVYGPGRLTFDLANQKVTADHDINVTVDGPFHLTSMDDPGATGPNQTTPPPTFELGYQDGVNADGDPARAAFIAKGDINISNGKTEGLGTLISRLGDVEIQPVNTGEITAVTSADNAGLVIFAGGDVYLSNPNTGGTPNWDFTGLVYARGGIRMDGKSSASRATFEGTLVALRKNPATGGEPDGIEFIDCNEIEFIYNPDLLSAFVNNLPQNRIQMEAVWWKS